MDSAADKPLLKLETMIGFGGKHSIALSVIVEIFSEFVCFSCFAVHLRLTDPCVCLHLRAATRFGCGEIFDDIFIVNFPESVPVKEL